MERLDSLYIINILVQVPMAIAYAFVLTREWRVSRRKAFSILLLFTLCLSAFSFFISWNYGYLPWAKTVISAYSIPVCFLLYMWLSDSNDGRSLFIFVSSALFNVVGAILGEVIGQTASVNRLAFKIGVGLCVLVLVYRFLRKPFWDMLDELGDGWRKMTLLPLTMLSMCLLFLCSSRLYYDPVFQITGIIMCIAVFCLYIGLNIVFIQLRKQYQVQEAYKILYAQLSSIQEQAASLRKSNDQLIIFRHDMRHFMQIQASCLKNGDMAGAEKVLESMDQNLSEIGDSVYQYTGCLILDALLSNYAKRADKEQISLKISLDMPNISSDKVMEFAVVLANSLDNAFNACMKVTEAPKRFISLRGGRLSDQIFLEIDNSYEEEIAFDEEHKPISAREGHGYGTQSVRAFAMKNQAYLNYQTLKGVFQMRMVINMNKLK